LEEELDKYLEEHAADLNISAPTGNYEGKWARAYFGWSATGDISYE